MPSSLIDLQSIASSSSQTNSPTVGPTPPSSKKKKKRTKKETSNRNDLRYQSIFNHPLPLMRYSTMEANNQSRDYEGGGDIIQETKEKRRRTTTEELRSKRRAPPLHPSSSPSYEEENENGDSDEEEEDRGLFMTSRHVPRVNTGLKLRSMIQDKDPLKEASLMTQMFSGPFIRITLLFVIMAFSVNFYLGNVDLQVFYIQRKSVISLFWFCF